MYDMNQDHTCQSTECCSYTLEGAYNNDRVDEFDSIGDQVANGRSFSGYAGIWGLCALYPQRQYVPSWDSQDTPPLECWH